jgi:NAD(P)H-dependent FMN reductase
MPRLQLIIGSTRPNRKGLPIGEWVAAHVRAHPELEFELDFADLAEVGLPIFDEPEHPRFGRYHNQHTKDWSARVEAADAFVWVLPEYNSGYNAALKNAIDYLCNEWKYKPVGFVSYGGVAGGTRAVQQLKQVTTRLKMSPAFEAVVIPFVEQFFDAEGRFEPNELLDAAVVEMLVEVARLEAVLRPLREEQRVQSA